MNRIILVFVLISMLAVSCAAPTAAAPIQSPTETGQSLPVASPTTQASATFSPTVTQTTIPATATLDLAHQPTATPQPAAVCPTVDPKARFQVAGLFKNKHEQFHDLREPTLEFLNRGGDPKVVVERFAENGQQAILMDLTNDGVPELFVPSGYLSIFGCDAGKFKTLLEIPLVQDIWPAVALAFQDLNANNIPELIIAQPTRLLNWTGFDQYAQYTIYEWDGSAFVKRLNISYTSRNGTISIKDGVLYTIGHSRASKDSINGNWSLADVDGNSLKDLTILAGINDSNDVSQLEERATITWNGSAYLVTETAIEPSATPIPSRTPHPFSATCDFKAPELKFVSQNADGIFVNPNEQTVLDYLNAGGNPEQLKAYFGVNIRDLNGDNLPDFLLFDTTLYPGVYLISCVNGKYVEMIAPDDNGTHVQFTLLSLKDLNKNGLPEIIFKALGCSSICGGSLYALEWNGKSFESLIKNTSGEPEPYIYQFSPENTVIQDVDHDKDGLAELFWDGGIPNQGSGDFHVGGPWRRETHIYKWDGKYYAELPVKYSDPAYRFQALQDGDRAALQGDYAAALNWYQKTIFSDGLDWWSPERRQYLVDKYNNEITQSGKTIPAVTPNLDERTQLSAYAYFREMLVYLLTGKADEAKKNYETLQRNYAGGSPGAPYSEMAGAFWTEYQASNNMAQSCQAAVAYAQQHPALLTPLGGDYHGMQSMSYSARDVCPFH